MTVLLLMVGWVGRPVCLPAPDGGWAWSMQAATEHVLTAPDRGVAVEHFVIVPSNSADYAAIKEGCAL